MPTRWIARLGLLATVACTAPEDDAPIPDRTDDTGRPPLPDLTACGPTCGDGPLFVIDQIGFVFGDKDGPVPGFDLDGLGAQDDADCDVDDLSGPDGTLGIDNQFATVFDALPAALRTTLPGILDASLAGGGLTVLVEVVGVDSLDEDGPIGLVFRRGAGAPETTAEGTILPQQTFELDEDAFMGATTDAWIRDGVIEAGPFEFDLQIAFLDTVAKTRLHHARLRLERDDQGGFDGLIGAMVPLEQIMTIVNRLGGCGDDALGSALKVVMPLLVDARLDPDGDCDAITGAFEVSGVKAYVFETP
ncbi:MAG: hypothetical protein H6732_03360 [Alphaproteobacteria bacterium]|nr:hypothetical protein [Alphaproteobacteria bacterium]